MVGRDWRLDVRPLSFLAEEKADMESRFLGTSGQNLDDIYKYLESDDRLEMAMSMLRWSHIAPTAPDTLCTRLLPLRGMR